MDCKKIQAKLLEYLTGELSEAQHRSIALHLKDCPQCQKEFEELKRTVNLFDQLPNIELSFEQQHQFLLEVRSKLRRQAQTKPYPFWRIWLLPRLVPALAAASILIFLITQLKPSDSKSMKLASEIFTSPNFSLSGEFVLNYFEGNSNGTALNSALASLGQNFIDEIEDYLINQQDIEDLVDGLTENEKTELVQKIEQML